MSIKLETVSEDMLVKNKWPIEWLGPPLHDAHTGRLVFSCMLVSGEKAHAAAQAFSRYKRANPGWDYRSKREGETRRFWRTA